MRHVTLISLALLFAACTPKEESKTSGIKITSETILAFKAQKSTISVIGKDDFPTEFQDDYGSYFVSEEYDDGAEDEAGVAASCYEKGITSKLTSSGHSAVLKATFTPDASCVAAEKAEAKSSVVEFDSAVYADILSFDMEWKLECSKDMSEHNNNSDVYFNIMSACAQVESISRTMTVKSQLYLWLVEGDGSIQELTGEGDYQVFMLGADGGPCTRTAVDSVIAESAGCITGYYQKSAIEDSTRVQYFLATRKGLTATPGSDPWYGSGTVDFEVADWQGTVTYSSGSKAPTYTATNGKANVSGDFTSFTGLTQPMRRSFPRTQFFGLLNH